MKIPIHTTKNLDDIYLNGILSNDSDTIKLIYDDCFSSIDIMVGKFNLRHISSKDIFQEGLTRAILNIRKGKFKGESKFSTYLYGICRIICLNESKKNQLYVSNCGIEPEEQEDQDYFELLQEMLKLKNSLHQKCKEIIDLRFNLNSRTENNSSRFESIAKLLGITADNARQRFKRCFSKLKSMFNDNHSIKLILD